MTSARIETLTVAVLAAVGGLLVAAGACLPWLTLYAGLYPLPGTTGLYGRLLLGAGVMSAAGAVLLLWRPRMVGRVMTPLAAALLVFSLWLSLHQLPAALVTIGHNPFLVARPAAGPRVLVMGSLLVFAAASVAVLRGGPVPGRNHG